MDSNERWNVQFTIHGIPGVDKFLRERKAAMECKIFYSHSRLGLQDEVNKWLKEHPVSSESMRFQFTSVDVSDEVSIILEHTLVLFFVPMVHI